VNRNHLGLLCVIAALGCSPNSPNSSTNNSMQVQSASFQEGQPIPEKYSNYADNLSPALSWSGQPAGTQSMALIVDDPDAPGGSPFVHWVVFNIPPNAKFEEGKVPAGAVQGMSGAGNLGYFGPRPPSGTHHYHFRVFALDSMLDLKSGASRQDLEGAMRERVLAQGELIGTYSH
jgi:Raf kinase inhibitor-like YbhB/YbcL family protein